MFSIIVCRICNKKFNRGFGMHLKGNHNIDAIRYYDHYFKKENEDICSCCGKKTSFNGVILGYNRTCSKSCADKLRWINKESREKFLKKKMPRGENHYLYGNHHSKETCKKMSVSHLKNFKNKAYKENFLKNVLSKTIQKLNGKIGPNKTEQRLLDIIHLIDNDFEFIGDGQKSIAGKWPDFINEKKKLIIEYNSDYFHRNDTKEMINDRINLFKGMGYNTLIINEKDFKELKNLRFKISNFVGG